VIEPITASEMRVSCARGLIAMVDEARRILDEDAHEPQMLTGGAMQIIREVADRNGITVRQILGKNRSRHLAWPRHEAYALIRERLGYSYPRIGQIFNRDHTTVLYGERQYWKRRAG
jgi:chromosomal replication initiation ATPase DnaA